MRAAPALLLFATMTFAGCGSTGPVGPEPAGELVIGGGHDDGSPGFVELGDTVDLELAPGAQGGFHVYLNVRVPASIMNPTNEVYLERQARRETTGELASQARQRARFVRAADPAWFETEEPFRMFMCPTPVGVPVRDEVLLLRVRAFEESADTAPRAEGELRFRPRCPAGDQAEFCARICSG